MCYLRPKQSLWKDNSGNIQPLAGMIRGFLSSHCLVGFLYLLAYQPSRVIYCQRNTCKEDYYNQAITLRIREFMLYRDLVWSLCLMIYQASKKLFYNFRT